MISIIAFQKIVIIEIESYGTLYDLIGCRNSSGNMKCRRQTGGNKNSRACQINKRVRSACKRMCDLCRKFFYCPI